MASGCYRPYVQGTLLAFWSEWFHHGTITACAQLLSALEPANPNYESVYTQLRVSLRKLCPQQRPLQRETRPSHPAQVTHRQQSHHSQKIDKFFKRNTNTQAIRPKFNLILEIKLPEAFLLLNDISLLCYTNKWQKTVLSVLARMW